MYWRQLTETNCPLCKTNTITVARIAYQASDLIISVQPSLAVDSEFSIHLKRYSGRKERSLVAKNVDAVPEVRIVYYSVVATERNGFRVSEAARLIS